MEPNRISDNFSSLTENMKDYINLRIDYVKLLLTEKIARLASFFLLSVIFFILGMFLVLFISFAFVFWYGEEVGPTYVGALIIVAFYIILGLSIFGLRNKLFINPLVKRLAKIIMEEEDENQ
ncbi:MAG: phage holin family protein [Bacteroidetes bacterium]|nr:phage holin family protein [Bacteroidota bacterium]